MRHGGRRACLFCGVALAAAPVVAFAADPTDASSAVSEIVVTAQKLDAARSAIEPSLGASTYSISSQTVLTLPGGENTALNQVLLQAPGVVQDSFGQLHIRGDHGNLQYRITNVSLPEGPSAAGRGLSPRLA